MPGTLAAFERDIDVALYSRRALAETQKAFSAFCLVRTAQAGPGRLRVLIEPTITGDDDIKTMILEFWNFLLQKACEERVF